VARAAEALGDERVENRVPVRNPRKKNLPPVIARYFDAWIRIDTWDSQHWSDLKRFYLFVKAVVRYGRPGPSAGDLQELIIDRWRTRRKAAERYTALYMTLRQYEKSRGFPDPLIELRDIFKCYNRLKSRSRNADYIERRMTKDWGNNWRTLYNEAETKKTGRGR
jgi:hypothetical protein